MCECQVAGDGYQDPSLILGLATNSILVCMFFFAKIIIFYGGQIIDSRGRILFFVPPNSPLWILEGIIVMMHRGLSYIMGV